MADQTTDGAFARVSPGTYRPPRGRKALGLYQRLVLRQFTRLYYKLWQRGPKGASPATLDLHWFGHQMLKSPLDLWIYQELLVELRPDVVIETGTFRGGSALYFAMLMDLLGHGRVITVDPFDYEGRPEHPRITYLRGSSTDPILVEAVHRAVQDEPNRLVVLDSDHSEAHVAREMRIYRDFVPVGGYLVVEDGVVNGHPVMARHGPGPFEAIRDFLAEDDAFAVDLERERFLMTMNPSGFLRRVRAG